MSKLTQLIVFAMLACSGGCAEMAWYAAMAPSAAAEAVSRDHRTVDFLVVDADTGDPMPGAQVVFRYGGWFKPDDAVFKTGPDGHAKKWLATNRSGTPCVQIDGYLLDPVGPIPTDPMPATWTIRAARAPAPYHVLEVPAGFRGVVAVGIPMIADHKSDAESLPTPGDANWPAGQRAWVTHLTPDRPTTLPSLPLLLLDADDETRLLRAQTSDGVGFALVMENARSALSDGMFPVFTRSPGTVKLPPANAVSMWLIARDPAPYRAGLKSRMYFCVGDRAEAVASQRNLMATTKPVGYGVASWTQWTYPPIP